MLGFAQWVPVAGVLSIVGYLASVASPSLSAPRAPRRDLPKMQSDFGKPPNAGALESSQTWPVVAQSANVTPFIGYIGGKPSVRVEHAKDNSRRIFACIDILASVDDVWSLLTDYDNLEKVVPSLVVNEVVERYEGDSTSPINYGMSPGMDEEARCRELSKHMRGSKLRQLGGAKVLGFNFAASVTLEVREWPQGIPDFFNESVYQVQSTFERAKIERLRQSRQPKRYHFPAPDTISPQLPIRDISMQSVEDDKGEFRLYQGVWRMQPLPRSVRKGAPGMRLSYAVEVAPKPYLPAALVELRISQDLTKNLMAIRDIVTRGMILA